MSLTRLDRYRGSLLGLACGDAVGTTVEFIPRGTFTPLTRHNSRCACFPDIMRLSGPQKT